MEILRFYKEKSKYWYADIPSWTSRKSALQMVSGADKLLDILAKGNDEVYVHFSENEIDGGDVLEFKSKSWFNGANYIMPKCEGVKYDMKVWLCNVTLHVLGKFPKKIYFKEVKYNYYVM